MLLRRQGDRWIALSMSARNKSKAVYWSISAQSSKMFEYFSADRKTATKSVTGWLIKPFKACCNMPFCESTEWFIHFAKLYINTRAADQKGWAYQWKCHIFLGILNDWQLKKLLCYTVGFNFIKILFCYLSTDSTAGSQNCWCVCNYVHKIQTKHS